MTVIFVDVSAEPNNTHFVEDVGELLFAQNLHSVGPLNHFKYRLAKHILGTRHWLIASTSLVKISPLSIIIAIEENSKMYQQIKCQCCHLC